MFFLIGASKPASPFGGASTATPAQPTFAKPAGGGLF